MKLNNLLVLLFSLLIFGCQKQNQDFDKKFYEKNEEWENYFDRGQAQIDLTDKVLLIMHSTECPPCIKEMKWWNENAKKLSNVEVILLLVEKYSATIDSFKKRFNINLKVVPENDANELFENNLIPRLPLKILFNREGNISSIQPMGTNGDLSKFIDLVKKS